MASLGGVYIYNCYSCCGCYRVIGAVIKVASSTVIRTTYNIAVKIASGINEAFYRALGIG
jgi:hypothetical protein